MAAQMQAWLAQCGVQVDLVTQTLQEYLAAGPDGAVFGRRFDLALLAWSSAAEPPCQLYLTSEIPGPYPAVWAGLGRGKRSGVQQPGLRCGVLGCVVLAERLAAARELHMPRRR